MNNDFKSKLVALGLAGVVISTLTTTTGETDEKSFPVRNDDIAFEESNVDNYYKYNIENGEKEKLYNSQNVLLFINRENYEIIECLYNKDLKFITREELYDLETEELLVLVKGWTVYNQDYLSFLLSNYYQVCLADVTDYDNNFVKKDYYTLEEIRELEHQVIECLKLVDFTKPTARTRIK